METLLKIKAAYESINGYKISQEVKITLKKEQRYDELEGITYGEIDVDEFSKLLLEIKAIKKGSINSFYDIGSGTVGIEIVESLHKCALEALEHSRAFIPASCYVLFICGDSFALTENKSIKLRNKVDSDEGCSRKRQKSGDNASDNNREQITAKKLKASVTEVVHNVTIVDGFTQQQIKDDSKNKTQSSNWYEGDGKSHVARMKYPLLKFC